MGMVVGAFGAATQIGIAGVLRWAKAGSTVADSAWRTMLLPGGVGFIDERACVNMYKGDAYIVGGFSHNLRFTKRLGLVIQGILPPTNEIVNAAGSGTKVGFRTTGTGLTANMIPYISFWDELTSERSPLSAAGPTVVFTNNAALWDNLPTFIPEEDYKIGGTTTASATTTITGVTTLFTEFIRPGDEIALSSAPSTFSKVLTVVSNTSLTVATAIGDGSSQRITVRRQPRWTHIELWRSVDGSLPRLVGRWQRGVTTVTESVAVGSLGEAFTEDFERFPRCKYGAIWRDRQAMAGFEEDPARLFLSLIGFPERKSDLELRTLNGEPIVGLVTVQDQLIVLCPTSSYVCLGYTEDDIQLRLVQPQLGCVSHHAIQVIHGNAWIPTHLGVFICNGSSWIPVNLAYKDRWSRDYADRPEVYENAFAVHDPVRQVYKIYLADHPDINQEGGVTTYYGYWCADYTTVVPQAGGGLGQPRWFWDTHTIPHCWSWLVALPGGRRSDVFMGAETGNLYKANAGITVNDGGNAKRVLVVHGADHYQDFQGDFVHGKTFVSFDLFLQNENNTVDLELYSGDEYAWPMVDDVGLAGFGPIVEETIAAGAASTAVGTCEPRAVYSKPHLMGVNGRALTVALRTISDGDWEYRGYQVSWVPGPAPRKTVTVVGKP